MGRIDKNDTMMNQEELKGVLAITASISTILQFLSGTLVCQKIVQKRTTGDISGFPFVCGFLSTSLWLRYGFCIQEHSIILVNTVGAALHIAYVLTFYHYSIKKSTILRQFFSCLLVLIVALSYAEYDSDKQAVTKNIGLLCCCVTILFFAAPLASLMHVIKVKSSESLPFPIIFTSVIVTAQWFFYGVLLSDRFVQIPNLLGCLLAGFQLSLFCIYPKAQQTTAYTLMSNF